MSKPLTRSDWIWVLKVGGAMGIVGSILISFIGGLLFPSNFKLFDSKFDKIGNHADLYVTPDPVPIGELCQLCRKNANFHYGNRFYVAFFFDHEDFARFPNTQVVTGGYSPWDEEESLRHVKAVYTYNRSNHFGELRTYEKNQLESVAVTRKIP